MKKKKHTNKDLPMWANVFLGAFVGFWFWWVFDTHIFPDPENAGTFKTPAYIVTHPLFFPVFGAFWGCWTKYSEDMKDLEDDE